MDNILPENEFVEIEGRQYLNPQTGLDESNAFIENLRAAQGQQNQQIAQDTYNLGTDIQSVQGGLGTNTPANMGYFTSRYQTPQTNSAVANLRAAAQAQALNEVLANEQAIWKKRYNDAYKNYQKRQYNRARYGSGSGTGPASPDNSPIKGGVDENPTGGYTSQGRLILDAEDFVPEGSRIVDPKTGAIISDPGAYLVEPASGNIIGEGFSGNNPRYIRQRDGSYKKNTSGAFVEDRTGMLDVTGLLTNYWKPASATNNNSSRGASGR